MKRSLRLVTAVLCVSYMLGAGGMIAMKYALVSFTVLQIVCARVGIAAFFYAAIFPVWRHIPYRKGDWKWLVAVILFEPCLYFFFEALAMKFTTASQGGVIYACFPICTAVAAWIVLHERLSRRTLLALVIVVAGVAGMSLSGTEASAQAASPLLGNLFMLGATLASTGYAVCGRYITQRYSPICLTAFQSLGGSLVFLPLLFFEPLPQDVSWSAILGLLYMGVGVGIVSYLCFNFALKHIEAGIVALLGNLMPIFTLVYAYTLLDERLNAVQLCFAAVTLLGVVLATTEKRSQPDAS